MHHTAACCATDQNALVFRSVYYNHHYSTTGGIRRWNSLSDRREVVRSDISHCSKEGLIRFIVFMVASLFVSDAAFVGMTCFFTIEKCSHLILVVMPRHEASVRDCSELLKDCFIGS